MIYLASPYNHPDLTVRERRFRSVCRAAGLFIADGLMVFSPIAHSHSIAVHGGLPSGWEYWQTFDRFFLRMASEVRVLTLPGWEASAGIKDELEMALDLAIPVTWWARRGGKVVQSDGPSTDLEPLAE